MSSKYRQATDAHTKACADAANAKHGTPEHEKAMDHWSKTLKDWRDEFGKRYEKED